MPHNSNPYIRLFEAEMHSLVGKECAEIINYLPLGLARGVQIKSVASTSFRVRGARSVTISISG